MHILLLPDELLLYLVQNLWLPQLQNLAATCRRLTRISDARLSSHRPLYKQLRCIEQDHCMELASWLRVFARIDQMDALPYVEELHMGDNSMVSRSRREISRNEEAFSLLHDATELCPYLLPDDVEHILNSVNTGIEDAVPLAYLHRLTNLRTVNISVSNWDQISTYQYLRTTISRIARKQPQRALTQLEEITASAFLSPCRFGLDDIVHFLALPSVKRVNFETIAENEFEWPEDLPKSHVASITLNESTVTSTAIWGLAKGIVGPCIIRQRNSLPRSAFDWNICVVPSPDDKEEDITLRYEKEDHPPTSTPSQRVRTAHWRYSPIRSSVDETQYRAPIKRQNWATRQYLKYRTWIPRGF